MFRKDYNSFELSKHLVDLKRDQVCQIRQSYDGRDLVSSSRVGKASRESSILVKPAIFYNLMILLFIIFSTTLLGSEDSNKTVAKESKNDVTSEVSVREIIPVDQEYHYVSMAKPNPFVPPLISAFLAKEAVPIESSLQKYPLQLLMVVGIWSLKNGIKKALIMTPESEGIVAIIGKSIGRRGGKIVAIRDDSILVREFSLASDGSRQYEESTLWLEGKKEEPEDKELVIRADTIMHNRNKNPYSVDKSEDVDLLQRVKSTNEEPMKAGPLDGQKPTTSSETKNTETPKSESIQQNKTPQESPQSDSLNKSSSKLGQ